MKHEYIVYGKNICWSQISILSDLILYKLNLVNFVMQFSQFYINIRSQIENLDDMQFSQFFVGSLKGQSTSTSIRLVSFLCC